MNADTRLWKEMKAKFPGGDEPEDGASWIRYLLVTDGVATFKKGNADRIVMTGPRQPDCLLDY